MGYLNIRALLKEPNKNNPSGPKQEPVQLKVRSRSRRHREVWNPGVTPHSQQRTTTEVTSVPTRGAHLTLRALWSQNHPDPLLCSKDWSTLEPTPDQENWLTLDHDFDPLLKPARWGLIHSWIREPIQLSGEQVHSWIHAWYCENPPWGQSFQQGIRKFLQTPSINLTYNSQVVTCGLVTCGLCVLWKYLQL